MSAISLKSITGITSITTPAGVDDQLTLHANNTTERVKIDVAGNVHVNNHLAIAGVTTASDNISIVKSSGPILELTTNTNAADASLRLHEGTAGSTTNGGGMFYSGADNKLYITCGTNLTTKRITINRDDGYIGIGVASPSHIVHIQHATTPRLVVEDTTNNVQAQIGADNTEARIGTVSNHPVSFRINDSEKVRITSGGSVNIGGDYTQTSQKLKVTGNTFIDGTLTAGVAFVCAGGFSISSGNVTQGGYTFHDADSNTYFGFPGADQFDIFTAGSSRMHINSDGRFRVGCTAQPSGTVGGFQLDMGSYPGTMRLMSGAGASGTESATIAVGGSNHNADIANGANSGGKLDLYNYNSTDGNSTAVSFLNSNSLSIARVLGLNVSHSSRTGALVFMVSSGSHPTEKARITSTGNVGINQTSPQRILHVGESGTAEANIRIQGGSDYGEIRVKDSDNALTFHYNVGGAGSRELFNSNGSTGHFSINCYSYQALTITTNENGVNGPEIQLMHNSASPAANDIVGQIRYSGKDSAGNTELYSKIETKATTVTSGSETGHVDFSTRGGGAYNSMFRLSARGTASAPSYTTDDMNGIILDTYNTGNPYPRYFNFIAKSAGNTDSNIGFWTEAVGGSPTEKLRISNNGIRAYATFVDTSYHANPDPFGDGSGIVYYRLNDNFHDSGVFAKHGTSSQGGDPTFAFQNSSGERCWNNPTDGAINIPNLKNSYPFSMAAWVNISSWPTSSNNDLIMNLSIGGQRVSLCIVKWSDRSTSDPSIMYGGANHHVFPASSRPTNTWIHLVYSVVASNNTSHAVYQNGSALSDINKGPTHGGSAGWAIGGNASNSERFAMGRIGSIRFFNKAISSSEASALYTNDKFYL